MKGGCPAFILLFFFAVSTDNSEAELGDDGGYQVAQVVGQVTLQHLAGCHIVLAATSQHSSLLQHITKLIYDDAISGLVVVGFSLEEYLSKGLLLKELWGDLRFTCRALILHLTNSDLAFRLLEASQLWLWPETRVVIVGDASQVENVLHHSSLRNAVHALYLSSRTRAQPELNAKLRTPTRVWTEVIEVYRRCLYCNSGEVGVQFIHRWRRDTDMTLPNELYREVPEKFMGHKFHIMAVHDFPISGFRRDSDTPGTTLTSLDSIDVRMIRAISASANFTYEVREPLDGQFGVAIGNGNWTGTVGALQHQQADFSMVLTPAPTRLKVVQFSDIYMQDNFAIFSLKPRVLPQHLAIIRPFPAIVWASLAISMIVWAATQWLLQQVRSWVLKEHGVSMSSTVLYSWGALLQNSTTIPPVNVTSRVLVGLWLVFCLIFATVYRSSLVAHLIVQDKDAEINTFQDLVARDGWQWGTDRIGDVLTIFFQLHPDPRVQQIFGKMHYAPEEKQFQRVLEGGYSYITFKYSALPTLAIRYTNKRGYTPIHISRKSYAPFAGNAWGFRKGAPFRDRISRMMQQLVEGQFIDQWLKDVIANSIRETKKMRESGETKDEEDKQIKEVDEGQRVLGMNHLQGAFYLLLIGCSVALLTLLGEHSLHHCRMSYPSHLINDL